MEKLYYHPSAYYYPDTKKIVCQDCGVELNENGMSSEPCLIPTAAQSVLDNLKFEISVWNCRAFLLCFTEERGKRRYYKFDCSEEIKEKIDKLAIDSVYKAGGAINFSGIYPLSEELENFLEERIKNKEITLGD